MPTSANTESSSEMQKYAAFDRTIQAFCNDEISKSDSIPEKLRKGYLQYLKDSVAEEAETPTYGLSPLHRLQQMLKFYAREGSNLSLRRLLVQMRSECEAESKYFPNHDEYDRAYKTCLNVGAVIETLAKYLQISRESSKEDFSSLWSQVVDLEKEIHMTLEPEQEVARTMTDWEHTEPDTETILTRAAMMLPELGYLMTDLEKLLKDWTRYRIDPSVTTGIEQRLWQKKEQFSDLIFALSKVAPCSNRFLARMIAEEQSIPPEQLCVTSVKVNGTANVNSPRTSSESDKVSKIERAPKISTGIPSCVCIFRLYGCDASFTSKNEWKRHINGLHMRSEIWRCDIDTCALQDHVSNYSPAPLPTPVSTALTAQDVRLKNRIGCVTRKRKKESSEILQPLKTSYRVPKHRGMRADPVKKGIRRCAREKSRVENSTLNTTPNLELDPQNEALTPLAPSNEYNRKDAFARHLKLMHYPNLASENSFFTSTIKLAQERCHVKLRELPTNTSCTFCDNVFNYWDDRLEHIWDHLVGGEKLVDGKVDKVLANWMIEQAFLERRDSVWRLRELNKKKRMGKKAILRGTQQ